jgi:tRNA (cmo5U34)-methyltransferase
MPKDKIFNQPMTSIKAFQFDQSVAKVFDDMVSRSVPIYHEVHALLLDLLERRYLPGTDIYDLGCSTGTTLVAAHQFLKKKNIPSGTLWALDNSQAMLEQCEKKFTKHKLTNAKVMQADLLDLKFQSRPGLVIMNYTLQFIKPSSRLTLLKKITKALPKGGIFILAEKIRSDDPAIEKLITQLYYDFKKRRGYSELEIAQKREALEKVLLPTTPEKQLKQLKAAGLKNSEMLFRWYNFAVYVGIK